ncbi:haloacid dehalogenase-like hydrolase, partial [Candidatus Fermentibacterales bacterium]|nr:haloacid dehalogenase-like hydrolase [Candidatus Fermentibacterales bacterium]
MQALPPATCPSPGICFVDLDGTLISCSSEKALLGRLVASGALGPVGLLRFALAYLRHPAMTRSEGKGWNRSYLVGMRQQVLRSHAEELARDTLLARVRPGVSEELRSMRESGCEIVVISAALEPLASIVGKAVGASGVVASCPEAVGGVLTGRLVGRRPWGREKRALAMEIAVSRGVEIGVCSAMGDSWSDRHLLEACGQAVAVHPCRRL